MYDTTASFPVYCNECWWSDKWNPTSYGMDFDFSRPFFEQFYELVSKVPKVCLLQMNNENAEYNAFLAFSKNSYLSAGSFQIEDCYFLRKSQSSKDCINSNALSNCELVAYSTNCNNCYGLHYSMNCRNCSDCRYMIDSTNCQNCFMCVGLNQKNYHFKNQAFSKEEYEKILAIYADKSQKEIWEEFISFSQTVPKSAHIQLNCENCTGDYLYNCKNTLESTGCFDAEDSKYLFECMGVKDSMDLSCHDKEIELCYEMSCGGEKNYNTKFCFCTCASPNSEYLFSCFFLAESFGSDGFHANDKNYILNKKYSTEEYREMKQRIVEHMQKTGEYGSFFPPYISPFGYNETFAQLYFPLQKEQALARGYRWKDLSQKTYQPSQVQLPENSRQLPDEISQEVLSCERCKKNYKMLIQELKLYQKLNVAPSKLCPNCRIEALISWRNPKTLWERTCAQCSAPIQTSYSPDRPEKVVCEKCYLQTIA